MDFISEYIITSFNSTEYKQYSSSCYPQHFWNHRMWAMTVAHCSCGTFCNIEETGWGIRKLSACGQQFLLFLFCALEFCRILTSSVLKCVDGLTHFEILYINFPVYFILLNKTTHILEKNILKLMSIFLKKNLESITSLPCSIPNVTSAGM